MAKIESKIIALGLFDSIHRGHRRIIEKTISMAKSKECKSALMTFDDGFFMELKRETKQIFTISERLKLLNGYNLDEIIIIDDCKNFLKRTPKEFFDKLNEINVVGIVCGKDYTFGKNAEGNTNNIIELANHYSIDVSIVDLALDKGEKISSTLIRRLLQEGEIQRANDLLGENYFIEGEVKRGRKEGRKLGTPTANIILDRIKLLPKLGVYGTRTIVNGKSYKSITNVGGQPTFDLENNITVETFILDFDQDIYEQTIIIKFDKYIRGVKKFESIQELREQIQKDVDSI